MASILYFVDTGTSNAPLKLCKRLSNIGGMNIKQPGTIPGILRRIAEDRAARIQRLGAGEGLNLPPRNLPLQPFGKTNEGILIAEIKRRSPSRGAIADIADPAALAACYKLAGFRRVSVLTESAYFGGSLADLKAVKTAHPDLAVLRKDFLLNLEDVEISHRLGADAILLIAALLDSAAITTMYRRAEELGLECLVEVHDTADINKIRPFQPPLVGINCRNLNTFAVDPLIPLKLHTYIDWPCAVIYESGIKGREDAAFVRGSGFSGFLVGETAASSPGKTSELLKAWKDGEASERQYAAWKRLFNRNRPFPYVKICGLTNRQDAMAAAENGADMLGFVLAKSPRQVNTSFVKTCADIPLPKVAVLVQNEEIPSELPDMLAAGIVDFVQFHGDFFPEVLRVGAAWQAMNLRTAEDASRLEQAWSPAVLIDAWSETRKGGTGKQLNPDILQAAAAIRGKLWIAGGLNPDNVGDIVHRWHPDLVDVSSGVEISPGRKDAAAMRDFVAAARQR